MTPPSPNTLVGTSHSNVHFPTKYFAKSKIGCGSVSFVGRPRSGTWLAGRPVTGGFGGCCCCCGGGAADPFQVGTNTSASATANGARNRRSIVRSPVNVLPLLDRPGGLLLTVERV